MADAEQLLIATRSKDGDTETEPVLIVHNGVSTVLVLDDGERIEFDATELRAAA